ncbi:MAG: DUF1730 domain-containing protein [Hydrogenoanaerobacterium sp.]
MQLEEIFKAVGIPAVGVCGFASLHPLLPCRAVKRLPQDAKSVLVCLFPFYVGEYEGRNIARYAIVDDYHTVTMSMLTEAVAELKNRYPNEEFVPFADNSPLREVYAAVLAGLGFKGKNGQLITDEYGSYCFIGEIITTLALPAAVPVKKSCGECCLCVSACPNGAIGENGSIKKALCRSYITQKKAELSDDEKYSIAQGGLAWGCDICTDICPHNKASRLSPISAFYSDIVHTITKENCEELCKTRAFGWRGADVVLRNLELCQNKNGRW